LAGTTGRATSRLLHHTDLAIVFHHAGMNKLNIRHGRDRICRRGLASLLQLLAERAFGLVQLIGFNSVYFALIRVISSAVGAMNRTPEGPFASSKNPG
jgi:hypothetical protein